MCDPSMGSGLETLLIEDTVVRENARLACEAVHLKLVKLARNREGLGYELRITPGGRLLVEGNLHEAAAVIDSGIVTTRLSGDPPGGTLGARLHPGGKPMPLDSLTIKAWVGEALRGIATGHLQVVDGYLHAVEVRERGFDGLFPVRPPPPMRMPDSALATQRRGVRGTAGSVSVRRGR